ncbi:hypothetical protein PIB30_006108, partial [Stylosanthes scabra]|nr:hypothetical protein [Stylosanthes scabra]
TWLGNYMSLMRSMHQELNRRAEARGIDVELLKQQPREELQQIQAYRQQTGACDEKM